MSGIPTNDECVNAFNKFKLQNSHKGEKFRYLIFRIVDEEVKLVETGAESASWSDFVEVLMKDEKDGAYGIFDFHTETSDGRLLQKIVFVAWSPDTLPVKAKMLYGSTRESFKSALGSGIAHTIQGSDLADLDEDEVKAGVISGR